MTIFNSASRVVLLIMAISVCILTGFGIIEPKDFVMLCAMAFSAYFQQKTQEKSDKPLPITENENGK